MLAISSFFHESWSGSCSGLDAVVRLQTAAKNHRNEHARLSVRRIPSPERPPGHCLSLGHAPRALHLDGRREISPPQLRGSGGAPCSPRRGKARLTFFQYLVFTIGVSECGKGFQIFGVRFLCGCRVEARIGQGDRCAGDSGCRSFVGGSMTQQSSPARSGRAQDPRSMASF